MADISVEDVAVELYFGRIDANGDITEPQTAPMLHRESLGSGRHLFSGTMRCNTSGRFGYTVRVLPNHEDLLERTLPGLIRWA